MCVVAIAWRAHPQWRLVVAGNRDEYHARASAPLDRWADSPDIIAGRDLVSGGTWMGVSEAGRFAVVTNIRNPEGPDPAKASRGALVSDWLTEAELPSDPDIFNPFNLIVGNGDKLQYLANRPGSVRQPLEPGIHGLSNAIADEHWPRKDMLNAAMADWLTASAEKPEALLDALADRRLPDRESYPIFINSPVYGTRCSTVITVDAAGLGRMVERRFDTAGANIGETAIAFSWPTND